MISPIKLPEGNVMKVLIAEDDPVASSLLEDCLQEWGYEVIAVADGAEAYQVLQADDAPQLAVLDWMMPELDGRQVCREVRGRTRDRYIYLILLTAKNQTAEIADGFEAGADDFLRKPFELLELRGRLLAAQRIVKLQDDLIAAREAMRHQATHDPLTGAWNHRAVLESLERELNRGQRDGQPVCALMVDLDHFKRVNDVLGHQAGDFVLQEVVRRMTADVRPYDVIGRYGGEEFVIVLPGMSADDAVSFAERLRQRIAAEPFVYRTAALDITLSAGLAHSDNLELGCATDLIHAADTALYKAKESGRNCVVAYSRALTPAVRDTGGIGNRDS
jgi:two-component system, cell cycle response regulator